MPRRKYYRRQADLCLQLALLQNDPQTSLLLAELAKELKAKADDADGASASTALLADAKEAQTYRLKPPDPQPPRRGPENQPA